MRSFIRSLALAASLLAPAALAQTQPVVVELFTSQGCSSCPPADAFLGEMVERGDVLPLALHVDYWDRLGWADTFASEAFTRRQYSYARTFGNRSVWTPQFVVHGQHFTRGDYRAQVASAVARQAEVGPAISLELTEEGGMLQVGAQPQADNLPEAMVIVVHYAPQAQVTIKRGENAGRTISYHNVVRSWRVIGRIHKGKAASFEVPMDMGRPVAVLVQAKKHGPMLAAQVLR